MRKLFKFYLKDSVKLIILFTVISILIAYGVSREGYIWHNSYRDIETPNNNPITVISIIAGVLATLVPFMLFNYKMRKITIDQVYSFPIKREKLFITKYLIGLIQIFAPVVAITLFFLLDLATTRHLFDMSYFLPYFLSMAGTTIIIYNITTFMFTRANTLADGVITVIFGIFFSPLIFGVIDYIIPFPKGTNVWDSVMYGPLGNITNWFVKLMEIRANTIAYPEEYMYYQFSISNMSIFFLVFNCAIAVISFVLSIILIKKDKSEDSMGISNSWFSYKVMIPVYLFCLGFLLSNTDFLSLLFLLLGGYILYVGYRRTLKIKWYDLICIFVPVVIGFIIGDFFIGN